VRRLLGGSFSVYGTEAKLPENEDPQATVRQSTVSPYTSENSEIRKSVDSSSKAPASLATKPHQKLSAAR
jgi:hypothetical protein